MTAIREYVPTEPPKDIWSELDLPNEDAKVREMVTYGFSVEVLANAAKFIGVKSALISQSLRIANTTLARRRKEGHFNSEESDRIFRLIEVTDRATDLFEGDRDAAVKWMQKEVPALGNKKPIEMLGTAADTLAVLKLITRLEYGVHS